MSTEVVPGSQLTRAQAEILTDEINREFGNMAKSHERARDLIRQAIRLNAPTALGYSGLSEYVSARFAGALARLGVETRREVVQELTAGGMSARAIAPVVGVSRRTVRDDLQVGDSRPPEPGPSADASPDPESRIVGLDGKSYTRPEPKPQPTPEGEQRLADYLNADPDLRRREQARKFRHDLNRSWALQEWEPEFVATILDDDDVVTITHLIQNLTNFRDKVQAARRTPLAVVKEMKR